MALAGGLNPMPISPQQPETTTLIDSFSHTWCAGATLGVPHSCRALCGKAGGPGSRPIFGR